MSTKRQSGNARRSRTVKIRVQPGLWDAVKARADELGVFPSSLVRDLVDLGLRWSLARVKRKLSVLHGILAEEERLDELLGGTPAAPAGQHGRLDLQSLESLLRGAVADPAPTFALLRALLEAHDRLGPGQVKEELGRALAELPADEQAAAGRRLDAAADALRAWKKLYAGAVKS